jgi:hypothetical protein
MGNKYIKTFENFMGDSESRKEIYVTAYIMSVKQTVGYLPLENIKIWR